MKLGLICCNTNQGLGTLSWEFAEHLNPYMVKQVNNGVFQTFPERFEKYRQAQDFDDLLGCDVVLSFETFYDWNLVRKAKKTKTKTALMTMAELLPNQWNVRPDLLLSPSPLDFKMNDEPQVFIPIPVNTDKLVWKERRLASHFIHTASHGGINGRKGTALLLEAMKYVKSGIKLTIYSWNKFTCDDPRIKIKVQNFKNYWQCWQEGDVLVYPQGANGICLPIIEAMSSGMAVLTTYFWPFNEYMPKELLFKPDQFVKTRFAPNLREVDDPVINPQVIAEKIDEIYNQDISSFSQYGKEWAQNNNWKKLCPLYQNALENLCR